MSTEATTTIKFHEVKEDDRIIYGGRTYYVTSIEAPEDHPGKTVLVLNYGTLRLQASSPVSPIEKIND